MAKFKRRTHRSYFGKKAHRASHKSTGLNPLNVMLPSAAYGALRGTISNAMQPLFSKIPLGGYADEAAFGLAGYFLAKKGRGMLKGLGYGMLAVESASVGNQAFSGMGSSTQAPVSGGWI